MFYDSMAESCSESCISAVPRISTGSTDTSLKTFVSNLLSITNCGAHLNVPMIMQHTVSVKINRLTIWGRRNPYSWSRKIFSTMACALCCGWTFTAPRCFSIIFFQFAPRRIKRADDESRQRCLLFHFVYEQDGCWFCQDLRTVFFILFDSRSTTISGRSRILISISIR